LLTAFSYVHHKKYVTQPRIKSLSVPFSWLQTSQFNTHQISNFILNSQENDKIEEIYSLNKLNDKNSVEELKISREIEQKQNIEGFLNNDLLTMESGKQVRVTLYIVLAILPCLLLIPFMMDRSFIPDIDPNDLLK
jgi:hypothetical protein